MKNSTWKFYRRPDEDYQWIPEKPKIPQNITSWIEEIPPSITVKKNKLQKLPVVFLFSTLNDLVEITAKISPETDEYGRVTAEITVNTQSRQLPTLNNQSYNEIISLLKNLHYNSIDYEVIKNEFEKIKSSQLSLFFGPESMMPSIFSPDISITETGSQIHTRASSRIEGYESNKKNLSQGIRSIINEPNQRSLDNFPKNQVLTIARPSEKQIGFVRKFLGKSFESPREIDDKHILRISKNTSSGTVELFIEDKEPIAISRQELTQIIKVIEALISKD